MTVTPDGDAYAGDFGNPFPSAQDKFALSESDLKMSAPNKQPARQGGAGKVNTHAPLAGGQPSTSYNAGQPAVQGNTKPIVTPGTGKNKNRLH